MNSAYPQRIVTAYSIASSELPLSMGGVFEESIPQALLRLGAVVIDRRPPVPFPFRDFLRTEPGFPAFQKPQGRGDQDQAVDPFWTPIRIKRREPCHAVPIVDDRCGQRP